MRTLAANGWRVRRLVRKGSGPADSQIETHVGDVTQPASLIGLCRGADAVFHAAALVSDWAPRDQFWQVNCDGTRNMLRAAAESGIRRFVHVSTADVFGFSRRGVVNEQSPRTRGVFPYPASKLDGEEAVWQYIRRGLAASIVYPTWVFGPEDRHLLPGLVPLLRAGHMIQVDRGRPPLELTFSENLAAACLLIAREPRAAGEGYLVGDRYGLTLHGFLTAVAGQLGVRPPRWSLPAGVVDAIAGLVERSYALLGASRHPPLTRYAVRSLARMPRYDLSKIHALGYRPKIDFPTALQRSLERSMAHRVAGPVTAVQVSA